MPSHLQGLNVVHPPQAEVNSNSQDLLAGSHFPDLTAQLALWTNLPFESEESPVLPHEDTFRKSPSAEDDEEEKRGVASHDSHVNVVTGTNIGTDEQSQQHPSQSSAVPQQQPSFDFNALINGFGFNAFHQQQQEPLQTPSLAQLLALHSLTQNASVYQQQSEQPIPPQQPRSISSTEKTGGRSVSGSTDMSPPPAKRARARKPSLSNESSTDAGDGSVTPIAPAEDKRRRNTAASARFRLKKKEREFALETKAKELEIRVNELERECEGLRRENGWLKGLVVGVTGAAQTNVQQHTPQSSPTLAGIRRPREDDSV
ncbi:hypothetical protein E1B28_000268 [Marasmius oreades]|uniref:BZIP domain-containing protein n=1 Tax=Marasmius oreades TaxID=181124 RepID=A0A9P8AE65_9AGAR|nr:uncharacterized protein E1B28_000268 [Marasmius oreades]KAG7098307.1 hypothetical protein E1B28_000268 [Marasmius oreades]